MGDFISKRVDISERCRQQAVDYAPTQWKEDHICWQAANEIDRLRAALVNAEAVMSIVEPRSDKAEYLAALDAVRAALTPETGPNDSPCGCAVDSWGKVQCEERSGPPHTYCKWERQQETKTGVKP